MQYLCEIGTLESIAGSVNPTEELRIFRAICIEDTKIRTDPVTLGCRIEFVVYGMYDILKIETPLG